MSLETEVAALTAQTTALLQAVVDEKTALVATQLKGWALQGAFRVVSAVRNSDGALTSAVIVWPDGTPGTFTATELNATFEGAIDAWQLTYAATSPKTITQPTVTRDAEGTVSSQPDLVIT